MENFANSRCLFYRIQKQKFKTYMNSHIWHFNKENETFFFSKIHPFMLNSISFDYSKLLHHLSRIDIYWPQYQTKSMIMSNMKNFLGQKKKAPFYWNRKKGASFSLIINTAPHPIFVTWIISLYLASRNI